MSASSLPFDKALNYAYDAILPNTCPRPDSLLDLPASIFSSTTCFKALVSRCLGLGILVFASIIKVPQVVKVGSAGSAEGLSLFSYLIETFGLTYNFAVHFREDYPISTYGEFLTMTLQNLVLIFLICYLPPNKSLSKALLIPMVFIALLVALCHDQNHQIIPRFNSEIPMSALNFMVTFNVPISMASRLPQIRINYQQKSTGQLSLITWLGMFLGAAARVFTTIQEVNNPLILVGYLVSTSLNGTILAQILYYSKHPPSQVDTEKKEQ